MKKLNNDATKTAQSFFYQCYIALEKCFELMEDEKLYIETYGDVSILGEENGTQIEVKNYEKNLTALDHNIWNTLKNWINDPNIEQYKNLILLTTQKLSNSTLFQNWNSNNKNKKLEILNEILKNYQTQTKKSDETQRLLENVLDKENENKLLIVLDKFSIISSNIRDTELYTKLLETRAHGLMKEKRETYIDSLIGFITSPYVSSTGWEISYESFQQKTKSLMEEYNSTTIIFPSTSNMTKISTEEEKQHLEYTFIKKIDQIDYAEVKHDAISDFIATRKIIHHELSTYQIPKEHYNDYEEEIHRRYVAEYRKASRNTVAHDVIKNSKNLYDGIIGEQAPHFRNFNNTPVKFKNGLLHQMADDDSDKNQRKIIWKLKGENE